MDNVNDKQVRSNDELGGTNRKSLEAGNQYCKENLRDCCAEILEWQRTGILRDGHVRKLARMFSFASDIALSVAEEAVKREAMRRCATDA